MFWKFLLWSKDDYFILESISLHFSLILSFYRIIFSFSLNKNYLSSIIFSFSLQILSISLIIASFCFFMTSNYLSIISNRNRCSLKSRAILSFSTYNLFLTWILSFNAILSFPNSCLTIINSDSSSIFLVDFKIVYVLISSSLIWDSLVLMVFWFLNYLCCKSSNYLSLNNNFSWYYWTLTLKVWFLPSRSLFSVLNLSIIGFPSID